MRWTGWLNAGRVAAVDGLATGPGRLWGLLPGVGGVGSMSLGRGCWGNCDKEEGGGRTEAVAVESLLGAGAEVSVAGEISSASASQESGVIISMARTERWCNHQQ